MRFEYYACDGCGEHCRRITVHWLDDTVYHFCSVQCMTDMAADLEALRIHINAEDINEGA